jgi:carboxymethylenebutenolidase
MLVVSAFLVAGCAGRTAQQDDHTAHMSAADRAAPPAASGSSQGTAGLPASNMNAPARLAATPRHGEWVKIAWEPGSADSLMAWIVYPMTQRKAPVVVVVHEIFGLSSWVRGVADQLAADGFIAVAPDLLSGMGPNGGDSSSIGQTELMKVTLSLPPAEVINRLKAAREWGLKQKGSNGKSATVGFCFGGSQSFAMAVAEPSLNAAVVYYGDAPSAGGGRGAPFVAAASLANIKAPVLGLYGGLKEDARIGATIEPTRMKMKELGKTYDVHIFEGAAHGFLRAQTGNNGANMKATQQAWPLTVAWIKKYAS